MQLNDLRGKVVVVTGGNSGMGRAIALGFLAQGAHPVIGDLGEQPSPPMPDGVLYKPTNVSKPAEVQALVDFAVSKYGRIDILVNNAGINGKLLPLAEQQESDVDTVFGVNVMGVFHGLKYGLTAMTKQRSGVIINIASVQGIRPIYAGASIYAASKAAVVSLTRSAAHEYGQYGIRVVAVAPGPIDTPMLRAADPEGKIIDAVPLHHIGTPEELASAVVWLASDAAAYVSGSLLTVDGGFLAA